MNSKALYEAAKDAGIATDNHSSDLYIKVSAEAGELIAKYDFKMNVTVFTADDGSGVWYEVPFAYEPWWDDAKKAVESWAEGVK